MGKQPQKSNVRASGPKAVDWREAYLACLAETGHCGKAAEAAGTSYTAVWRRRKSDPEFAADYADALSTAANTLEAEAVRRAREGLRQYKFTKAGAPIMDPRTGEPYFEHVYSDTILLALLKRFFPKEYRERQEIEHAGQVSLVAITEEQRQQIMDRRKAALSDAPEVRALEGGE